MRQPFKIYSGCNDSLGDTEQNRTDATTLINVKCARGVPDVFELTWMQGIWKIVACVCMAAAIHKAKEMH